MGSCATVRVQTEPSADNPSGLVLINQSDYDANPSAYTLADPPSGPPAARSEEGEEGVPSAPGHKSRKRP